MPKVHKIMTKGEFQARLQMLLSVFHIYISTQLNSKMFICNMQEHTYNHIGSLKPMTGLFDSTYI